MSKDLENNKLNHLGVILDGNRRWAVEKGLSTFEGHTEGAEALRRTIEACIKNQIEYLTVYVFSTENWKRTEEEVSFLMKLAHKYIGQSVDYFQERDIAIKIFGDLDTVKDRKLAESLKKVIEDTKGGNSLKLNICFNYGGRLELVQAVKNIIKDNIEAEKVDEETIGQYLYSSGIPDPDMIVRTSGEQRLSNFLPWQSTYSELHFMDMFWPDFNESAVEQVIAEFKNRQRRFGK